MQARATRKAYNFTTEDIASYVNELDLDGRRLACVAGSGDLPINAFLYGAAAVDAVDISPVACLFSELKVAGVLLIQPEGPHPYLAPGAMLISNTRRLYKVKAMSPYLQGRYRNDEARRRARPVLFHPQPVDAFLAEHPDTYDVVHLSNTHTYGGDPVHTVALAAAALRRGGQVVVVDYTLERIVDGHGCPVFVSETHQFGYPGRYVVAPTLNGKGSVRACILDVRS